MDLYIDREELGRGLARVQNVVERRSTQPVLSHVLLHAREGGLRMTATDTEAVDIGHGKKVATTSPDASLVAIVHGDRLIAIASVSKGVARVVTGFPHD